MPITVPTKTEDSLGIEKSDNVPEGVALDPRHWTKAAQLEALKSKVIELAEKANELEAAIAELEGAGGGITALTGDGTASGTGSVALTVDQARGLRETAGPTTLTMGAVADGQMLVRDGTSVRGEDVPTAGVVALFDLDPRQYTIGNTTHASTALAALGTPVFVRHAGGGGGTTGYEGLGTPTASIVGMQSMPSRPVLRLTFSASIRGGWLFPLLAAASIPAEGCAIEVELAGRSTDHELVVMPLVKNGGGPVIGFGMHQDGTTSVTCRLYAAGSGGVYGAPAGSGYGTTPAYGTTPDYTKAPTHLRVEVRRASGFTPARWELRAWLTTRVSGAVNAWGLSGVSHAVVAWDGLDMSAIAVGMHNAGAAAAGSIDIAHMRVLPLED